MSEQMQGALGAPPEQRVGRLVDAMRQRASDLDADSEAAFSDSGVDARLLNAAASELERLLQIAADAERWAAECNKRDDHISAWLAACAFIDAHVADPDMTAEMGRTYAEFQKWRAHLKPPNPEVSRAEGVGSIRR
jgi:hypothetical protein